MKRKLSCNKLNSLIEEEKKSAKEYASYGFDSQADDELRHARYFKRMVKKCN